MTAVTRIELRCDRCPTTVITDMDHDDGHEIIPSKWSYATLRGGFGDSLTINKHLCPTCTSEVASVLSKKP